MSTEPNTGLTFQEAGSRQTDALQNAELNVFGPAIAGAVTRNFASDANITLVAAEHWTSVLVFTDTGPVLTTGRDVIFPARFPLMWVRNSTAQTLTLKKTGQTGIAVPAGETSLIAAGLTDVVASATGGSGGGGGGGSQYAQIMLSDMTTGITTGTGKAVWFAPCDGELVDVWLAVGTQSSSGVVRIDMNDSGGTVFTTRPSIDASEDTSLTGTAAVLDGTVSFSKGAKFTFDIDDAGTGAKALMVTVEYEPTA